MQIWFSIQKSTNVFPHIIRVKKEKHDRSEAEFQLSYIKNQIVSRAHEAPAESSRNAVPVPLGLK